MARLPILAAALLTLAACQQAEAPATAPATGATPAVATTGRAQLAPAFTLIDSEGVARSLADFRAKTVVIEWTNEGCPYVQKHYSSGAMQALQREAVADGVVWLTVISSAPGKQGHVEGEGARAWRTRNNAASTHLLLDPEGTVGKAYGAMTTPDMRVIDGEGRILFAGGIDDLMNRVLRTPSTPEVSFGDDPLRMLRGARFTSQLGFALDAETAYAMESMRESISIISAERIGDEIAKLLRSDNPRAGIEVLMESGLAEIVLPEIPALRLEIDEHHHHKDVYQHTLTVLEQAIGYEKSRGNLGGPAHEPDLIIRLAALLHDIGKPATRKLEPGGVVSFYHHDVVGSKLAKKRLRALRYDNETINAVAKLIELHLRFFGYTEGAWTDSAVRRYVRDAGDQLERLHILTRADVTTRNRRKADRLGFAYDDLEHRIAALAEKEEMDAVRPDLDGEQIMAILEVGPGREVGEAYRFLLEQRLDDGPLGATEATRRLQSWWAERS